MQVLQQTPSHRVSAEAVTAVAGETVAETAGTANSALAYIIEGMTFTFESSPFLCVPRKVYTPHSDIRFNGYPVPYRNQHSSRTG